VSIGCVYVHTQTMKDARRSSNNHTFRLIPFITYPPIIHTLITTAWLSLWRKRRRMRGAWATSRR
jgi:hypothetical protein